MKSEKPEEDSGTEKAACLARNFYTKNINLEISSQKVVYEPSTPILTSEGSYDAIKVVEVTKGAEVTCKARFNGQTFTANATESGTSLWYSCKVFLEVASSTACCVAPAGKPDTKVEKVNMMSMAVLGLRVLLAKSIAFNTLMSIKLFLF
ncbi:TRDC protein, partial [Centropus unirufus]|nr:TRDC protein [Centropus unirufus]